MIGVVAEGADVERSTRDAPPAPFNFSVTLRTRMADDLRQRILYGELRSGDVF
jgi:hypothetical protein